MDLCYVQGPDLSLKLLDSFGFVHEVFRLLVQFCQMLGLILRFSCLTARVTYLIIRFGNSQLPQELSTSPETLHFTISHGSPMARARPWNYQLFRSVPKDKKKLQPFVTSEANLNPPFKSTKPIPVYLKSSFRLVRNDFEPCQKEQLYNLFNALWSMPCCQFSIPAIATLQTHV